MYDELTTDLRRAANTWLAEEYKVCAEAVRYLLKESADAIEELQEDNAALNGTVSNLIGQIAELNKPKWIPVTERLPEVRTWVLCYCRANSFDVFRMTDEGDWQYGNRSIYMKGYVTHWMPLPQPPKEG